MYLRRLHVFGNKNTWLPSSVKEEKGSGTLRQRHFILHAWLGLHKRWNMGRGSQLASGLGKDTKTSHHHLGTMSLFTNGTVLMRLQVLKSYNLEANDASGDCQAIHQICPRFPQNTLSWRIFKWHYSINCVTNILFQQSFPIDIYI